jgi:hypothetical protein
MKPKHKSGASPNELGGKAPRKRRSEVPRRVWLWLVAILLVGILLAGECVMLLPVE